MLFRLILLLAIAGGLILFALSNGSTLTLTFLGMQAPPLPLSLWVLGAIAAGILTHVLIASLFRISNLLAAAEARSQLRREERRRSASAERASRDATKRSSSRGEDDWDGEGDISPSSNPSDRKPAGVKTKIQDPIDDWESDTEDDWDDEPREVFRPSPQPEPRPATSYSYPPRQPLGKTEARSPESSNSVVDADFRVLVPPTRSVSPQPVDADDWFEDDDLETDEERRRRSER